MATAPSAGNRPAIAFSMVDLAGTVGPDHDGEFAPAQDEVDAGQHRATAQRHRQALGADDLGAAHRSAPDRS